MKNDIIFSLILSTNQILYIYIYIYIYIKHKTQNPPQGGQGDDHPWDFPSNMTITIRTVDIRHNLLAEA